MSIQKCLFLALAILFFTCPSYGQQEKTILTNDAGIRTIEPNNTPCSANFTPTITLFNYGTFTLTTCDIIIEVDDVVVHTESWTGSLAATESELVSLSSPITIAQGNHILKARTNLPNNSVDANTANDENNVPVNYEGGGQSFTLTIHFDNYSEETSWEIKDIDNNIMASGSDYDEELEGSTIMINTCLPSGCYDFVIYDTYGDGMCCAYGEGFYTLTEDGTNSTVASGGDFGTEELTNFCVGESLAVDLLNFEGAQKNQAIQLNWETGSETNNQAFLLEHSLDGQTFKPLATTTGKGTTNTAQKYQYLDEQPTTGLNYYQLKPVDLNGKVTNYKTIVVDYQAEVSVHISPNPIQNNTLNIHWLQATESALTIELFNLQGQLLKTVQIEQATQSIAIPLPDLPKGIYMSKIYHQQQQVVQRFVVD